MAMLLTRVVKHLEPAAAAVAEPDDDLACAVAVEISDCGMGFAVLRRPGAVADLQPSLMRVARARAAEHFEVAIASHAETREDLGLAISVEIADRGVHRAVGPVVSAPRHL